MPYSSELMDRLAQVLADLVADAQGKWQDSAEEIAQAMEDRGADGNLDEVAQWLEYITKGG